MLELLKATSVSVEQVFLMFNNFIKNKFNLKDLEMSEFESLWDCFVKQFISTVRIYRLEKDGNGMQRGRRK
jgi:RNAse (barnase) inhibitor barstar